MKQPKNVVGMAISASVLVLFGLWPISPVTVAAQVPTDANIVRAPVPVFNGCANNSLGSPEEFDAAYKTDKIGVSANKGAEQGAIKFTIKNETDCAFPLSASSYQLFDMMPENNRLLSLVAPQILPPGGNMAVDVRTVNCMTEIRLWYGEPMQRMAMDADYARPSSPYSWYVTYMNSARYCSNTKVNPQAVCPKGNFQVVAATVVLLPHEMTQIYAPDGWTGGLFQTSTPELVGIITEGDFANVSASSGVTGTAYVSGADWIAPNGAAGCNLQPVALAVGKARKVGISKLFDLWQRARNFFGGVSRAVFGVSTIPVAHADNNYENTSCEEDWPFRCASYTVKTWTPSTAKIGDVVEEVIKISGVTWGHLFWAYDWSNPQGVAEIISVTSNPGWNCGGGGVVIGCDRDQRVQKVSELRLSVLLKVKKCGQFIGRGDFYGEIGGIWGVGSPVYVSCPPDCPTTGNGVSLTSSAINAGQTATALPPNGWSGGSFASSNAGVASVSGATVTGVSAGSASISGSGWTAPNGAKNCQLSPAPLIVSAVPPPPPPPKVVFNFYVYNTNTGASSGLSVPCNKILVAWMRISDGSVDTFKVFAVSSGGAKTLVATVPLGSVSNIGADKWGVIVDPPSITDLYSYQVYRYKGGVETPPPGNAIGSPIAAVPCDTGEALADSNKDITKIRNVQLSYSTMTGQDSNVGPAMPIIEGDTITYSINLVNRGNNPIVTPIQIEDQPTNLVPIGKQRLELLDLSASCMQDNQCSLTNFSYDSNTGRFSVTVTPQPGQSLAPLSAESWSVRFSLQTKAPSNRRGQVFKVCNKAWVGGHSGPLLTTPCLLVLPIGTPSLREIQ